jgi:alpha-L-rhamnosidase
MYGKIISSWRIRGKEVKLSVTIPANTVATVYIPTTAPDRITESGKPVRDITSIKFLRTEDSAAVYKVGSGVYEFSAVQ